MTLRFVPRSRAELAPSAWLRASAVAVCFATLLAPRTSSADETRLGPDGRTRPIPGLIAGGTALALVGAAGVVVSSLVLLQAADDEAAVAGGGVGLGAGFVAMGVGTGMVIYGAPRRVASAREPGPRDAAAGVSLGWRF